MFVGVIEIELSTLYFYVDSHNSGVNGPQWLFPLMRDHAQHLSHSGHAVLLKQQFVFFAKFLDIKPHLLFETLVVLTQYIVAYQQKQGKQKKWCKDLPKGLKTMLLGNRRYVFCGNLVLCQVLYVGDRLCI